MLRFRSETEFKETAIGLIPRDWQTSVLGNQSEFSIIMGQSPPSQYYNKEGKGLPFIQGKTEFGSLYVAPETYTTKCSKVAPANSVIITVRAPVGELNIAKSTLCIGRGVASISVKGGNPIQNRFLYYMLEALKEHMSSLGERGTTYDAITREELDNFQVFKPSDHEQCLVATVLSWLDDLRENKRKENEILEKIAMTIFRSWFVNFEPFQDGEFSESDNGRIPKGWIAGKVGDVDFRYGEGLPESRREEGAYPVVGSSGILGYHSSYIAPAPSVVVGRKGNAGVVYLMLEPCFPIDTVFYTSDRTSPEMVFYLYHYLKTVSLEDVGLSDTAVPGLNINVLRSVDLVVPPLPDLEKFRSLAEPLYQKILFNQRELLMLGKVKDSLLPLLVFGKLRVEEI